METNKIYVGNIPFEANLEELRALFGQFGPVLNIELPMDPAGIQPHRGFAHVTLGSDMVAANCISSLDGFNLHGRPLRVQPPKDSSGSRMRGGAPGLGPRGGGHMPRDAYGGPPHGYGHDSGFAPRSAPVPPQYAQAQMLPPQQRMQPPPAFHPQAPPPMQPPPTVAGVRAVVEAMSAAEQFDVLATLRAMCETPGGREGASELLSSCPSFAHAVLMMEERLGMLQALPSALGGGGGPSAGEAAAQATYGGGGYGPPQQQQQQGGGGDDHEQLRRILAYSDADIARMTPDERAAVVQVRNALSWPDARIAALPPVERHELLTLRAELQAALRQMGGPL